MRHGELPSSGGVPRLTLEAASVVLSASCPGAYSGLKADVFSLGRTLQVVEEDNWPQQTSPYQPS